MKGKCDKRKRNYLLINGLFVALFDHAEFTEFDNLVEEATNESENISDQDKQIVIEEMIVYLNYIVNSIDSVISYVNEQKPDQIPGYKHIVDSQTNLNEQIKRLRALRKSE